MGTTGNELNVRGEGQRGRNQRLLLGGEVEGVEGRRSRLLRINGSQREEDIQVVDLEEPEEQGGGHAQSQSSQSRLGGDMGKVIEDMLKKVTTQLQQQYEGQLSEIEKEKEKLANRVQQLERQLEVSAVENNENIISLRMEVQTGKDKLEQVRIAMDQLGQFPRDLVERISTVTSILSAGPVGGEGSAQEDSVSSSQIELTMNDSSMMPILPVLVDSNCNGAGAKPTSVLAGTSQVAQVGHGHTISPHHSSSQGTSSGLKIKLIKLSQQPATSGSQVVIRTYKKVTDSSGETQKVFSQGQGSQIYGLLCERSGAELEAARGPEKRNADDSSVCKKRLRLSTSKGAVSSVMNPHPSSQRGNEVSVFHAVDSARMAKGPGFFCICSEHSFASRYTLETHISRFKLQWKFSCQYCDKCYRDSHTLKNHVRNVHSDLNGPSGVLQCASCGDLFPSHVALTQHQQDGTSSCSIPSNEVNK